MAWGGRTHRPSSALGILARNSRCPGDDPHIVERRVRIALIHMRHARSGGTERYLSDLGRFLVEHGHEVTIVCRSHVEAPHPRVRFHVLHDLAVGPAWRMWAFARAVESYVAESDFDLVYGLGRTWTHDVVRLGGGCHRTHLELALAARPPLGRLRERMRLKHRLTLAIEERALAPGAFRRVVTNSEMVRADALQRHSLPVESVSVIHNGVDLERFHPRHRRDSGAALRRALGTSDDGCTVLFLGTGYSRKGLDTLLDAFPELLRARPGVTLVVVGYDSSRARYEARAQALGIAERVRFLGGRHDPQACYAAADLYVLPTLYDPFANSTLEALASGLPVITTPTNGASELIEPGVQGEVLAPRDVAALSQRLIEWTDAARLREASVRARELAERHSIESKLAATEELLLQARSERLAG